MVWSNKSQYRPVFGQDCSSVIGYCEKSFDFVTRKHPPIEQKHESDKFTIPVIAVKQVQSKDSIIQDILEVIEISPQEMLQLSASRQSKIDEIFDFFYQHAQTGYVLCNIILCKDYLKPEQPSKRNPRITHSVTKIHFGHQVFLIIPCKMRVDTKDVIEFLKNSNPANKSPWGGIEPSNFRIKINSDEGQELPYVKFNYIMSSITKREDIEKILVELEKKVSIAYNSDQHFNAIKGMYHLRKIVESIKRKYPLLVESPEKIYSYDQLFDLLIEYSILITGYKGRLENGFTFSIQRFTRFYSDLSTFYNLLLQYIKKSLKYNLPINIIDEHEFSDIYKNIDLFQFTQISGKYMLALNDNNYTLMMNCFKNSERIIVTPDNYKYLIDAYSQDEENFQWFYDLRGKPLDCPKIITNHQTKHTWENYIIGKAKVNKPGVPLDCNYCKTIQYWICENCRKLLRCDVNNRWQKCDCNFESLDDIKFFCFSQWDGQHNNVLSKLPNQILPQIPAQTIQDQQAITPLARNTSLSRTYNILFIGSSGAGKSTLINSIPNYQNYSFFETAKNNIKMLMPAIFNLFFRGENKKMETRKICIGELDENEHFNEEGQSTTQRPRKYPFRFNETEFNIIDTPGLMDSRGIDQDKINLNFIRDEIAKLDELHGICLVLKSNESKLGTELETCLRGLLSLFPKTAISNIFYFFTHSGGTFGGVGDTMSPLKMFSEKLQETNDVTLTFEENRIVCVENESFHYLVAQQNGHRYEKNLNRLQEIWDESAQNIKDFFKEVKTVTPIRGSEIRKTYHLENIGLKLINTIRTSKNTDLKNSYITVLNEIINQSISFNCMLFKNLVQKLLKEGNTTDLKDINRALNMLKAVPELKDDINALIEEEEKQRRIMTQ